MADMGIVRGFPPNRPSPSTRMVGGISNDKSRTWSRSTSARRSPLYPTSASSDRSGPCAARIRAPSCSTVSPRRTVGTGSNRALHDPGPPFVIKDYLRVLFLSATGREAPTPSKVLCIGKACRYERMSSVMPPSGPGGAAYCRGCGSLVTAGAGFCPKCGASLGVATASPSTAPPPAPAPAGPAKKSRKLLWVVIVVVIVVIIVIVAALAYVGTSAVKVTAENWTIDYAGSTSGYFGATSQTINTSFSGSASGSFNYTLTVTSSAPLLSHNISSIAVASPFTLASISPALPISVGPGGSASVLLTINFPSSGGSYVMSGTITTF